MNWIITIGAGSLGLLFGWLGHETVVRQKVIPVRVLTAIATVLVGTVLF